MFSHMIVRRDGGITREGHSVFAQELTERLVRVSILTSLRLFKVSVEEC
jgi:hypothetical protein